MYPKFSQVKFFFLFFAFVCIQSAFGQQGKISLIFQDNNYDDTIPVDARLYLNNNELVYRSKVNFESNVDIDSINVGNYVLKVYLGGKLGLTFQNVNVKSDSVITLNCDLSSLDPKPVPLDPKSVPSAVKAVSTNDTNISINHSPTFSYFIQMFQPPFSNKKEMVERGYTYGIRLTPLYYPSKRYGIGANIGTSGGFNKLENRKLKLFSDSSHVERYVYWKLFLSFNNRIIFKQPSKKYGPMYFLDMSIGYNLPLIYHYEAVNGNSKHVIRSINNYNDFSAFTRLAFGWFSLTAEYRLTKYIKSPFPDVPRLMLGVDLLFFPFD